MNSEMTSRLLSPVSCLLSLVTNCGVDFPKKEPILHPNRLENLFVNFSLAVVRAFYHYHLAGKCV